MVGVTWLSIGAKETQFLSHINTKVWLIFAVKFASDNMDALHRFCKFIQNAADSPNAKTVSIWSAKYEFALQV